MCEQGHSVKSLYARINVWQFTLPALADRRDDIAPNIAYQLVAVGQELGRVVRFSREAYERYLDFAMSERAVWSGNFRDLSASILRLGTLAYDGRIDENLVADEIERLKTLWANDDVMDNHTNDELTINDKLLAKINAQTIDEFDKMQLLNVIKICQNHDNLASAGRALFNHSRLTKSSGNDSDRLRKYLGKFGIAWRDIYDLPK